VKLDYKTYAGACKGFKFKESWEVFSGNIDRHDPRITAIRIKFADSSAKEHTFGEFSSKSSKIGNYLKKIIVKKGDRIAVLLFPSIELYSSFFGIMKAGAVVIPCFPLFGEEAIVNCKITRML